MVNAAAQLDVNIVWIAMLMAGQCVLMILGSVRLQERLQAKYKASKQKEGLDFLA